MDKELQRYFENYFDLFASAGWTQFIEDLTDTLQSVDDIESIHDANEFYNRKGQIQILRRILNFKDMIEQSYKEQTDAEENL